MGRMIMVVLPPGVLVSIDADLLLTDPRASVEWLAVEFAPQLDTAQRSTPSPAARALIVTADDLLMSTLNAVVLAQSSPAQAEFRDGSLPPAAAIDPAFELALAARALQESGLMHWRAAGGDHPLAILAGAGTPDDTGDQWVADHAPYLAEVETAPDVPDRDFWATLAKDAPAPIAPPDVTDLAELLAEKPEIIPTHDPEPVPPIAVKPWNRRARPRTSSLGPAVLPLNDEW